MTLDRIKKILLIKTYYPKIFSISHIVPLICIHIELQIAPQHFTADPGRMFRKTEKKLKRIRIEQLEITFLHIPVR